MADIRTAWVGQAGAWLVEGGDLASDNGLETAVILSLFTDALATTQEARDAGVTERRGWWADAYAEVPGDRIGSKLWLLSRSKRLPSTLKQAQQYAADALAWLVADGVAESVDVVAELVGTDILGLTVTVRRRAAPVARYRFDAFWKGA